ncbi:unnamed protein product [Urochloa humidicola]
MDHNNAGPRAACVTILITLLVFLLSAIAIIFRLDDRTAGALRAALACLIFIYMAYLLFEVKVLQLLLSLFHPAATYDPQPPMSFVGHFSPLGSSVGREPSPEEAAGGGPAPPPPAPSSEAGYMASDSEYVPEPAPFSGGGGCYHRRRGPSTRIHRSSSSRWSPSSVSSSSEVTDVTSEDEVESWMGGSSRSPSRGRRRSRHGGGTVAYTKLKQR